ncbi:MAG TPA: CDP-diacylglycerol--glycerol-3-phosphate 3-phosphatidyltransferase [Actinopolymorphaceae bacterium]
MTAPEPAPSPEPAPTPEAGPGPKAEAPSRWNVANGLTVLRILLVPLFGALLLADGGADPTLRMVAFAVFTLAALTDKADGTLARRYNLITDFGKLADPIADKALIGMALVGLSVLGELSWWITIVIMARELGITALRLRVRRRAVIAASRGGKVKTVLQVVAIALLVLPLSGWPHTVAMIVMAAAVVVTVVTGLDYVVRAWRLRGEAGRG